MPELHKKEDDYWYSQLLSLKISPKLLRASAVTSRAYKGLYLKLFPAVQYLDFRPNETWQLNALSGDMVFYDQIIQREDYWWKASLAYYAAWSGNPEALECIKMKKPEILQIADNRGRTIAYYAALSGNAAVLDWINTNKPELLEIIKDNVDILTIADFFIFDTKSEFADARDKQGLTVTHYAALSGSSVALNWFKLKKPELLDISDSYGLTIGHYAALSGNPVALDWIKNNKSEFLDAKDYRGRTIAHYVAASGNVAALAWINANKPELLDVKDRDDLIITHYAAWSGNPAQFNYSLELSANPSYFVMLKDLPYGLVFSVYKSLNSKLTTLCQALGNNYILTSVVLPPNDATNDATENRIIERAQLKEKINNKVQHNRVIQKVMQQFTIFLQGQCQKQNVFAHLPTELLQQILLSALPKTVPEAIIANLYNNAWESINPLTRRIIRHINEGCLRLNQSTTVNSSAVLWGFVESSNQKIIALKALSNLVKNHQTNDCNSLTKKISQWQEENSELIDHQRNRIHAFFRPNHKTSARKLMEDINRILEKNKVDSVVLQMN